MTDPVDYDEFGLFAEIAAEYGLPFDSPPAVRRAFAGVSPGRRLSALVWQDRGHSLQGDTPLELAGIIEQFVFGPALSRQGYRGSAVKARDAWALCLPALSLSHGDYWPGTAALRGRNARATAGQRGRRPPLPCRSTEEAGHPETLGAP